MTPEEITNTENAIDDLIDMFYVGKTRDEALSIIRDRFVSLPPNYVNSITDIITVLDAME